METLNQNMVFQKFLLFGITGICLLLALHAVSSSVYGAESESDTIAILKILQRYEIDDTTNFFRDVLREIGFGIVKFLGKVIDGLYDGIQEIYSLLSFGSSKAIQSLVDRYSVLYKSVFLLSITALGLYFLCGKNFNQLNTANCLLLIAVVLTAMPLITTKMADFTISSAKYVQNQWVETAEGSKVQSISSTVLKANLVDLRKVDQNLSGTKVSGLQEGKGYNNLKAGKKDWRYLDINETMENGDDGLKQDFWDQELVQNGKGEYELENMTGWLTFDSYYYRYQVISWFYIIALQLCSAVLLFVTCLKCGILVWEVAQAQVYLPFVALTDLAGGQRIREAVKNFLALFATVFLCIALLGIYFAAVTFIESQISATFPKLAMHIALVIATMKGPDILERICGVEIGASSVWQKLMGLRAAAGIAGGMTRMGAAAAGMAGKAGAAAGRMMVGKERMQKAKEKVKTATSGNVRNATDGKGLLGFGTNAGLAMQDKLAGTNRTESLERNASKADAGFGTKPTEHSQQAERNLRQKQPVSPPRSVRRPERGADNLSRMEHRTPGSHTDAMRTASPAQKEGMRTPAPSSRGTSEGIRKAEGTQRAVVRQQKPRSISRPDLPNRRKEPNK